MGLAVKGDRLLNVFARILKIIGLCSLLFIGYADASEWSQFQKDALNSGISTDEVPDHPGILWSADLQRIAVTPVISSGQVFVSAGNGSLWAFDEDSGDLNWRAQMDGWVFQTSTPVCSGEMVFSATDSGYISAFDVLTGKVLWNRSLTSYRFEVPLTYLDGRLFLGEGSGYGKEDKKYFCIFENGTECWNISSETTGYMWCGCCAAGDFLVFGQNDGKLLAVNRNSGKVADEVSLDDPNRISFKESNPGRIRASVTCSGDFIYTTSETSANEGFAWKIGFDRKTGRFQDRGWSVPVGFSTSTPTVFGSRVYLGAGEHGHPGTLFCLDDSTGEVIWTYPVEAGVKASPAISAAYDRPRILFTTAQVNGSVYCLQDSGDTADLLWKFNPSDGGYILGGIALSNGRVYFGTEGDQHNGKLYCLADQAGLEEWPQFHLNPQHRGYSTTRAPRNSHTIWISEMIGAQPGSSVAVSDGLVIVNCIHNLTCLDQRSGEILWTYPFKDAGDYAFGFTPVYHRGRVFFTSDRTFCLNASDGSEVWSFTPPTGRSAIDGSPAIADGRVVVSDWDGHHYYCLDEETGKEMWNFMVDGNAQSTPAIDQNRVIFGAWDWGMEGKVHCADLENGSEIWSVSTDNSPCGSATIHEGVAYIATYNFQGDGDLLALSIENGSVLWKAEVSPTDSTPALAEGRVYICGGCEGFSELFTYCFDALRGEMIWRTSAQDKIGDWRCSPACADGMIFVGQPDFRDYGGTFALNASNGEIVWSYPEGGSSPAVADGTVYTVGDGRVYAFGDPDKDDGLV